MNRPINTLFMLSSVDGKISTGDTDVMDVDTDFSKIEGVKEGLHQYYEIEKTTDFFSLNSGRVFAKIGFNKRTETPEKIPVTFVVIDNKPHLEKSGVTYLSKKGKHVVIVTTNKKHPAIELSEELSNLDVLYYEKEVNFENVFEVLKREYDADRMTIQSGGTLNAEFIQKGLVDYVSVVVAPVIVGGKDTSTLVDGESVHDQEGLHKLKPLKLESVEKLDNSYVHYVYKVLNG